MCGNIPGVWSKTLRKGGLMLESHVIDLKTREWNSGPLGTRQIFYLVYYRSIKMLFHCAIFQKFFHIFIY